MNLEQQVVSLELAKRMKELGFKQESLFEWISIPYLDKWEVSKRWGNRIGPSAYTVAELGEFLPFCIDSNDYTYQYETAKTEKDDLTEHSLYYTDGKRMMYLQRDKIETDVRAKMLIYLVRHGLMEVPG